jgi:hypothetical protein
MYTHKIVRRPSKQKQVISPPSIYILPPSYMYSYYYYYYLAHFYSGFFFYIFLYASAFWVRSIKISKLERERKKRFIWRNRFFLDVLKKRCLFISSSLFLLFYFLNFPCPTAVGETRHKRALFLVIQLQSDSDAWSSRVTNNVGHQQCAEDG